MQACLLCRSNTSYQAAIQVWRRYSSVWAGEEPESFSDVKHLLPARRKAYRKVAKQLPFVDELTVELHAGQGGDGCVAFHREARVERGGPSGGSGGIGGSIYIQPSPQHLDLSSVTNICRAKRGANGQGSWMSGVRGSDVILKVPFGTVVKEIKVPLDEEPEEDEETIRDRIFVHYPGSKEDFGPSSKTIKRIQQSAIAREHRAKQAMAMRPPLVFDLSSADQSPILLARGGLGGMGNSILASTELKLPRFATRGQPGEKLRIHLELKSIADVGLVGMPNRGKSSLLRALSNTKSRVASFAFTTLFPHIAPVVILEDGTVATDSDTVITEEAPTPASRARPKASEAQESFRFTIADTPGLLRDAASNGLGSTFLRHIERARILACVVDLSLPHPELELDMLMAELEAHDQGLSNRVKLVIANKADLFEEMTPELADRLESLNSWAGQHGAGVVTCSAKRRGNMDKLAWTLRDLLCADADPAAAVPPEGEAPGQAEQE